MTQGTERHRLESYAVALFPKRPAQGQFCKEVYFHHSASVICDCRSLFLRHHCPLFSGVTHISAHLVPMCGEKGGLCRAMSLVSRVPVLPKSGWEGGLRGGCPCESAVSSQEGKPCADAHCPVCSRGSEELPEQPITEVVGRAEHGGKEAGRGVQTALGLGRF